MLQCRYKVNTAVEVTMCTLDEIKKELASKNNVELIQSLVDLNKRERASSADILLHLIEVEQRKLHLEYGYSSLFSYACKELHYSAPAAPPHQLSTLYRAYSRVVPHAACGRGFTDYHFTSIQSHYT